MRAGVSSLVLPLVTTLLLAVALFVVALSTRKEAEKLRIVGTAPRASLAAPIAGPAIYEGAVFSTVPRVSPLGKKSAAFWWWVEQKSGKTWKVVCSKAVRDTMELRAERVSMKLSLFTAPGLSLIADTREDWTERLVIDLGSLAYDKPTTKIPSELNQCAASGRTYTERRILEGTKVEVLGCYKDGELGPCGGPLGGALSVPSLEVHRAHRRAHLFVPVRIVAIVAAMLLFAMGFVNALFRVRVLGPLSRKGGPR